MAVKIFVGGKMSFHGEARKQTAFYNIGFSEAKAMFKQKSSLV